MVKVLPGIEEIKYGLSFTASGIVNSHTLEEPHSFTQLLARETLKEINHIQCHQLWCAPCVLHPGLMSFHFVCKESEANYRKLGECLVRRMIFESTKPNIATTSTECDQSNNSSATKFSSSNGNNLGSSSWSVSRKMSFHTTPRQSSDELSMYLSFLLTEEEVKLLKKDNVVLEFWILTERYFLFFIDVPYKYLSPLLLRRQWSVILVS